MLEAENITKKYAAFTAIEKINLTVEKGMVYGLIGYNGAGKTTLLKTICGLFKPEEGVAKLDNQPVFDSAAAKARIFFVPDDPYILPQASMAKMAKIYQGYYPNWSAERFEKLSALFKLDVNKRMQGFSKGMKRQAFIIFALSLSPDYLLLDEAFDGLDPMMQGVAGQLIKTLVANGSSVIISSHNLMEMQNLCHRVGVINGKRMVYDADINNIGEGKHKYRVILADDINQDELIAELGIKPTQYKREGKMIILLVDDAEGDVKEKLSAKSPVLFETLPLTLEEIFLLDMETQNYDFSGLFTDKKARL